jgi:uncharacterized membrane protein YhaH (DUF805 family)
MGVYLSVSGRLSRLPYFGYSVLLIVITLVLSMIAIFALESDSGGLSAIGIVIAVVAGLGMLWGSIAIAVKRLHDLNMSGWHYVWMVLVPAIFNGIGTANHSTGIQTGGSLISLAIWAFLLFAPGTPGPNRFG